VALEHVDTGSGAVGATHRWPSVAPSRPLAVRRSRRPAGALAAGCVLLVAGGDTGARRHRLEVVAYTQFGIWGFGHALIE
jgi:hypothetical protein